MTFREDESQIVSKRKKLKDGLALLLRPPSNNLTVPNNTG